MTHSSKAVAIGRGAAIITETTINDEKKPKLVVTIPGPFVAFKDDQVKLPQQLELNGYEVRALYDLLKEYYEN